MKYSNHTTGKKLTEKHEFTNLAVSTQSQLIVFTSPDCDTFCGCCARGQFDQIWEDADFLDGEIWIDSSSNYDPDNLFCVVCNKDISPYAED
jgi:hypothetical protein